ncbi:MAG: formylmethanofuran dehydrogenase subunit C [Planctomycetaceae bacterium]
MSLTIRIRQQTSIPVEVDSLRMDVVREQSADEVKATLIQYGNKQLPLGEFFDVQGSAGDEHLVWEGDCSHVKLIGSELASGEIRVEGNAGMHLGAEMTGGEITVTGDVADWAGAEMHGGLIQIHGNAGHLPGAVYRGGFKGMTGGEILIHGHAGNEIGHGMRRGLIAVGGRSGDAPGVNMIAGSIFLFGNSGIRPGAGMKRGSIVFFGREAAPAMLPTFRSGGRCEPVFLRTYLQHLKSRGFPVPEGVLEAGYDRYNGDFLETGKGEILIRAT